MYRHSNPNWLFKYSFQQFVAVFEVKDVFICVLRERASGLEDFDFSFVSPQQVSCLNQNN